MWGTSRSRVNMGRERLGSDTMIESVTERVTYKQIKKLENMGVEYSVGG